MKRIRIGRRLARVALAAVPLIGVVVPAAASTTHADRPRDQAGPSLNGGGSSFAQLEIDQWRAEVARKPFNLGINYVAQGSSFGRQQYIAGNLDFAASDIPFTPPETSQLNATNRKDFVYVPVSAGGLGIMYNLIDSRGQQVTNLKLTRNALCRMFTEPNMMWNDGEIQAANPDISLPAQFIRPVVRSDGSGTSYVFSEFCLTVAPQVWQAFVTARSAVDSSLDPEFKIGNPTSNWPQGWGKSTSALAADGVAAVVADPSGQYSVTYNEAGFAKIRGFPNAYVQNAAGNFTLPTEDAVSTALGYAEGRPDGTFKLNYTGGDPDAYFPSTYSYVIAQTTGFSPDKGLVLAKFLCYAVTKGQRIDLTSKLEYARLSAPLVELAKNAIAQIPGAPPWDQCKVDAAAPPPAVTTTTTIAAAGGGGGGGGGGATTSTTVVVGGGGTTSTTVAGATPVGGGTTSTIAGQASGAPSGGSGTGGSSSGGGTKTPVTSIVIDPVTGSTSVVTVPEVVADTGECIDQATGLPADASTCTSVDPVTGAVVAGGASSGGGTPSGGGAVNASASGGPAAQNPTVESTSVNPPATKIVWWLLQGASICGLGVAMAGLRKRVAG